jgi:tRNA modification GTPase
LAYIEAVIDFPDEEVPDDEIEKMRPKIVDLLSAVRMHLDDNRRGERLRDGIKIAVIGAPNAGKSTLINTLAQRDIAIVSDMAGTTRDIIEAHLNIAGFAVIIADTAGLRPELINSKTGHDAIEGEGMKRALEYAQNADIKLLLFDGSHPTLHQPTLDLSDINAENQADKTASQTLHVVNKLDKHPSERPKLSNIPQAIEISAKNGDNIDVLLAKIAKILKSQYSISRDTPFLTRSRHRQNIENMAENLDNALDINEPELLAQELRFALYSIGRITGKIDVEDLLDVIFKDFCIGK